MEYYLDLDQEIEENCDYPEENLKFLDEVSKRIWYNSLFYEITYHSFMIESPCLTTNFSKKFCAFIKTSSEQILYKDNKIFAQKVFNFIFLRVKYNIKKCTYKEYINNYPFYVISKICSFPVLAVGTLYVMFHDFFKFYSPCPLKINSFFRDYVVDDIPKIDFKNLEEKVIKEIVDNHFISDKNYLILFIRMIMIMKIDLKLDLERASFKYIYSDHIIEDFIDEYFIKYSSFDSVDIIRFLDTPWFRVISAL